MPFPWFSLSKQPKFFEFRCHRCGEIHRGSPSFGYNEPPNSSVIEGEERAKRVFLTKDLCIIDDDEFYIRGILEIPIHGVEEPFTWGVWVSQSRESFERYRDTYDEDQSGDGSFGWLTVTMPGYVDRDDDAPFTSVGCNVHWGEPGRRPLIVVKETDHLLYHDQTNGISWDRAIALAQQVMHGRAS